MKPIFGNVEQIEIVKRESAQILAKQLLEDHENWGRKIGFTTHTNECECYE